MKNFAEITRGNVLVRNQDEKAQQVSKFFEVLELNQNVIFGDAVHALNKNRQVKLRRPEQLPAKDYVVRLKAYAVKRIAELTSDPY